MLDPKTSQMFYFTGKKHTTPNCPLEIVPDFNPSAGVPSYLKSDSKCSRNAKYFIPFFLERPGPRYMQWSVNAHEARPGHHTQVSAIAGQLLERFGFDCFKTKIAPRFFPRKRRNYAGGQFNNSHLHELGNRKNPVINSLSFSDKVMPNIFRTLVVV